MKRSNILCGIMLSIGLLLTGCSNSFDHMPNLTEEESALIAEYTAGILLKHDKNAGRLVSDAEIIAADERAATLQANTEEFLAAQAKADENENADHDSNGTEESGSDSGAAEPSDIAFEGIAQFCGIEGFQIGYAGHMVCDSYPPADGTDMFFAMDASEGSKLLVLKFMAENTTSEDRELDMLSRDIRFRVSVNGGAMESVLSTLLLDDFATYKDTIPAGSSMVVVLVGEVREEEADAISTISLSMQSVSGNATTLLE